MFEFLKKKIKKSIDDVKKAFTSKEEKPTAEVRPLEPVRPEEEKVAEEIEKEVLAEEATEAQPKPPDEAAEQQALEEPLTKEEQKVAVEVPSEIVEEEKKEIKHALEKVETKTEEMKEEVKEVKRAIIESHKKKESIFKKITKAITGEKKKEAPTPAKEVPAVRKQETGFAEKISKAIFEKKLSESEFEKIFRDLEISLLEANIAFEVIQLLKKNLKDKFVDHQVKRGKVEEIIMDTIGKTFKDILIEKDPNEILHTIKENKKEGKPTSFLFLGVNGVGKTTSLAKMTKWLQKNDHSVVIAASDTFRAASIEQLEKHAENLGVKVIKHKYGADPAAVAFDAIEYAKAHKIDCVVIDSAGRQHSNTNLMDELRKLKRVAKPTFTIFIADALTGNDAVEQAREFSEKIGYDFSILAKADVDQKGGAILSVSYISKKPIAFLGVGQSYNDLEPFDKEKVLEKLLK
jgi:fused signal recognition particle receptor